MYFCSGEQFNKLAEHAAQCSETVSNDAKLLLLSPQISHDWDRALETQALNPDFYGHMPESWLRRGRCLTAMFFMSIFNLAVRVLICVNLAREGAYILLGVFSPEMGLYFLYKAVRQDLAYWTPVEGINGILLTFFARLAVKIGVD